MTMKVDERERGYDECISDSNTIYIYKIRSFKYIRQRVTKTRGLLRSTDWKRKGGILVLSAFQYYDFRISLLSQG